MTLPDVALHRWNRLLAVDQGADLGWAYGPWFRRQGRPAVARDGGDTRRFRLVAWPVPHPPNWELCNATGAADLGVPVLPDDDLVLLFPSGTEPAEVDRWAAMLRAEGHEVIEPEPSA